MKNKDIIGKRFTNKKGCEFIVLERVNSKNVLIKFLDENEYCCEISYSKCVRGNVKNPFFPSVCNIGYLGIKADGCVPRVSKNGKTIREYRVWSGMLNRCYGRDKKPQSYKHSNYEYCTVCERWLCFANFLEDLPLIENYHYWLDHPNERVSLDKDYKQFGLKEKIYSLETCRFVSFEENNREILLRYELLPVCLENLVTGEVQFYNSIKEACERNRNCSTIYLYGWCMGREHDREGLWEYWSQLLGYKWRWATEEERRIYSQEAEEYRKSL